SSSADVSASRIATAPPWTAAAITRGSRLTATPIPWFTAMLTAHPGAGARVGAVSALASLTPVTLAITRGAIAITGAAESIIASIIAGTGPVVTSAITGVDKHENGLKPER